MAQAARSSHPYRITVDVDPSFRRRVEHAAAARNQTVGQYVVDAIKDRLGHDRSFQVEADVMTVTSDPVLAELWDNPLDAEYDRLESR